MSKAFEKIRSVDISCFSHEALQTPGMALQCLWSHQAAPQATHASIPVPPCTIHTGLQASGVSS